jgi:hypothetical protein
MTVNGNTWAFNESGVGPGSLSNHDARWHSRVGMPRSTSNAKPRLTGKRGCLTSRGSGRSRVNVNPLRVPCSLQHAHRCIVELDWPAQGAPDDWKLGLLEKSLPRKNSVFATALSLGALAEMIASSKPSNRLHGRRFRKSVGPNRVVTRSLYYQPCLGPR